MEKQDELIEQLKENQLALTDLVESKRDVITLNKELPFLGELEQPKESIITVEPNNRFGRDELEFINKTDLIEPNKLLNLEKA